MKPLSDEKIVDSWKKNVNPWISAIENNEIASRVQVTNHAIRHAILERAPKKVLDVGCGEGWLVREMTSRGIDAMGIDVIPEFIDSAKKRGLGRFAVLPYEKITDGTLKEKFDVAVCNFSLLGETSVDYLIEQLPKFLEKDGALIVQTIHPVAGCGEGPYQDGWRQGTWAGFSTQFTDPAPWYFRTLENWMSLLEKSGFTVRETREPRHQQTREIAAILFIAEPIDRPMSLP